MALLPLGAWDEACILVPGGAAPATPPRDSQ